MKTITIEIPDGYEAVKTETGYEIVPETNKEKKWEDFGRVSGWFVGYDSNISSHSSIVAYTYDRNVFPTKKEANAYGLALPQLLQWRDKVNGDWKADWSNDTEAKHCIVQIGNIIGLVTLYYIYAPLHFGTIEIAEQFLKDHKSLIEQLIL